jgi:2-polyprenyl-3-methyl-5-hydroxy-6-metoxy-1,4-benzoquinol methylase
MSAVYCRENCPLCGNNKVRSLYSDSFDNSPVMNYLTKYYINNKIDFSFLNGEQFIIEECLTCGLIYQKNILNEEYMSKFYDEWLTLPEETNVRNSLQYHKIISREIEKIIQHFPDNNEKLKFLDFGAGWGDWGKMANSYSGDVYAVELSVEKKAHLQKNGINILDMNNLPDIKFDFINTEQVFEHIPDPGGTLKTLCNLLKDNGIIKISVPNGAVVKDNLKNPDWFADRFGARSLMPVQPLEHINCFRTESIDYMANQNHLTRVSISQQMKWDRELLNISIKDFISPLYKSTFKGFDFILCLYYKKLT